jgi:hypothetical protein
MAKNQNGNGGTAELTAAQTELEAAQAKLDTARETALAGFKTRLSEIDAERKTVVGQIQALGGKARGTRGRRSTSGTNARASNEMSLKEAVATVLRDAKGPLSPTEVAAAVNKLGYKTDAENYSTMVSQTLSNLAKLRIGKSAVASNPKRGEWVAGSATAIKAYIADPSKAVEATE